MNWLIRTVQRIQGIIKPNKHSIFIYCWNCLSWGINFQDDFKCGNCGSWRTTEYYPTRNNYRKPRYLQRLNKSIMPPGKMLRRVQKREDG